MKKNLGFTLIELLVVISIIGIMSALGLALFSKAQGKARDGQRKLDITSIAKTLEIHKTDSGYQKLLPAWFEKNSKPADPKGGNYCGCEIGTSSDLTNADWGSNTTVCPVTLGVAGCTGASWSNVSTTDFPTPNASSWRVCAHMETNDEVFCKHNVQ